MTTPPLTQTNNIRAGVLLMIAATVVFALQDGVSRYLAGTYNTWMVVMVRYWFFGAFVIALAVRASGGTLLSDQMSPSRYATMSPLSSS